MMRKSIFRILLLSLPFLLLCSNLEAQSKKKKKKRNKTAQPTELPVERTSVADTSKSLVFKAEKPRKTPQMSMNYAEALKNVEKDIEDGLPKSALERIGILKPKAKGDAQFGYYMRFVELEIQAKVSLEDNLEASQVAWNIISDEIATSEDDDLSAFLYLKAARILKQQFNAAHYRFRTELNYNDTSKSINLWSPKQLNREINRLLDKGLKLAESIPNSPVYEPIITNNSFNDLPLTIYQTVAHNAIEVLKDLDEPVSVDYVAPDLTLALGNASAFLNAKFNTGNDPKNENKILTLHQIMVSTGYLYFDLKRLQYVKENYNVADALYFDAVNQLYAKKRSDTYTNLLAYEMASLKSQSEPAEAVRIIDLALSEDPNFKDNFLLKNLKYNILKPEFSFKVEAINAPDKKILALITAKNVKKVYVSAYKIDYFRYKQSPLRYDRKDELPKVIEYLKNLAPADKTFSIDLPAYSDYRYHRIEAGLEGLPTGYYLVVISNNNTIDDSSTILRTATLGIGNAVLVEDEEMKLYHAQTGKPLSNEPYKWYKEVWNRDHYEYSFYTAGVTDVNGKIIVPKISGNNYSEELLLECNKQSLFHQKYIYRENKYTEKETESHVVMTDRSIYRPGQTVYFKCIAYWNKAKTTIPNTKIKVVLNDYNWKEIASLNLVTNSLGSASGSFVLPQSGFNTGSFNISTGHGQIYFQVEEYKRPKYTVEINDPAKAYSLNDEVEIEGVAKAYAGYAIQDASVEYTVTRRVRPVYYWWFYKHFSESSSSPQTIITGKTKTDADGKFKINFKALPDLKESVESNPYFIYEIKAIVTDINGEVREQTYNLTLAYTNLQLSLSGSETFREGQDIELYYSAQNLQDKIVKFSGEIILEKIVTGVEVKRERFWEMPDTIAMSPKQFGEWFPGYEWNEQKKTKEITRKKLTNDSNGRWLLKPGELKESGEYLAYLTALDNRGKEVKTAFRFNILQTNAGTYKSNKAIEIYPQSAKETEPGNTVKIIVASGVKEATVLLKAQSHRGVIWNKTITLNEEIQILEIPVTALDRGNIALYASTVYDYRRYESKSNVNVPYSNKELEVKIASYRGDIEPGSKEKWTITLKGPKSEKAAMEVLAGMYDQSLDALYQGNSWMHNFFYAYQNEFYSSDLFGAEEFYRLMFINDRSLSYPDILYPELNYYEVISFYGGGGGAMQYRSKRSFGNKGMEMKKRKDEDEDDKYANEMTVLADSAMVATRETGSNSTQNGTAPPIRKNFNETAFFLPHLKTNEKGEIVFEFTAPEALTKWKMQVFAHSTTLQTGYDQAIITTSKKVMVQPNMPRFLRQGDVVSIASKIVNTTAQTITAKVVFAVKDEATGNQLNWITNAAEQMVIIPANNSVPVSFTLKIPDFNGIANLSVTALSGDYSDGEQHTLPVLTNRMLVTETLPITVKTAGTQNLTLDHLKNNTSNTLVNHKLAVEMCNNPAWYAVQALPYMMEFPHECAEQTFTRLYANSIAQFLANKNPEVKNVYAQWEKEAAKGGQSLQSKLLKNQDLKTTIIEETPWLQEANSESERMKKLAALFNSTTMSKELKNAWFKLEQMQSYDGGWSWFPGMHGNEYITQTIVIGFGKMKRMGINISEYEPQIKKAITFLDEAAKAHYNYCKQHNITEVGSTGLQYLYAKSYFTNYGLGSADSVMDFYLSSAENNWQTNSLINKAQLAVAIKILKPLSYVPAMIMKSLNETAIQKPEMGMYWPENKGGCYWFNAPIETQAAIVEAFLQNGEPKEKIKEQLVWLLRQKQTQSWKTTRSTADACYALLSNGNFANSAQNVEVIINNIPVVAEKKEAGTGYFRQDIPKENVNAASGNIIVKSNTADFAYGAVYWQYFEDFNKIPSAGNGLTVVKKIYKISYTNKGRETIEIKEGDKLKVGDVIEVSLTITSDRNLEFVHIKDGRASGAEPSDVISSYRYGNGLGYYQSTRDASTNFFVDYMNKGTYQLNYTLKIEQEGMFNSGIATVQCMYAPEYNANSTALIIKVSN